MTTERVSRAWKQAAIVLALLLFALGLIGQCHSTPDDPNPELARATRQAIEMAQEVQARNDTAQLAAGQSRLLAVVLGVSIVIAGAVTLVIVVGRTRPSHLDESGRGQP